MTAAAPPSEVGQHCSLVSGEWSIVELLICSSVVGVLELGVGIVFAVKVIDAANFGEVFRFGAISSKDGH